MLRVDPRGTMRRSGTPDTPETSDKVEAERSQVQHLTIHHLQSDRGALPGAD